MVQALVTYLIVALAAVWVLWSVVLPARLRHALRRTLARRSGLAAIQTGTGSCGEAGCPGCDRPD
ncbi:MAG: hypothetical protein OEQ29_23910 [Alphaproteobacteria bacterium]|nr:hypothetical protein [Alphaproteobacteria bacterium]